ncbi:MAG: hypothetical protein ACJAVK_002336 [Akkermansiaceae bacterium]|jgi:hypothetical protein
MWTKRKAISEAQNAIQQYQSQVTSLESERREVQQNISEFKSQCEKQYQSLAKTLIGEIVDEDHFLKVSQDWKAPSLIEAYKGLVERRSQNVVERDNLLHHKTIINRSTLVDSDDATLKVASHDAQSAFLHFTEEQKKFNHPSFQWLYTRNVHSKEEATGFRRLWKIVTLESNRKISHLEKVKKELKRGYIDLVKDHDKLTQELVIATSTRDLTRNALLEAQNLILKFDELNLWDLQFESIVTRNLSQTLHAHFVILPISEIMLKTPNEFRIYSASLHALSKKIEYAEQLEAFLRKEIGDRQDRISSISNVHTKWRRNPSGHVRGDKSKWLQDIPEMKRVGTTKRVGWSRSMRGNLCGFNRYGSYGNSYYHSYDHGCSFLAFDVFNHSPEVRMPYEGFSSQVIPEVSELREQLPEDWVEEANEGEETIPEQIGNEAESTEETEEAATAALAEELEDADESQDDDIS